MKMLQEVKINNRKEVRKMKTSIALLTNLIISSTLFWGVPTAGSQELMLRVPAETTSYCHMKFPPISEESLFSGSPLLNESAGNSIDFYGSCDHDPLGVDEIRAQRELLMRGYFGNGD
jgi:hypothetical protein